MRANREEQENGRFFQDRYRATRLADEASLLACAAYVDLNLIRAAMAETLETSDHPSVQRRIETFSMLFHANMPVVMIPKIWHWPALTATSTKGQT